MNLFIPQIIRSLYTFSYFLDTIYQRCKVTKYEYFSTVSEYLYFTEEFIFSIDFHFNCDEEKEEENEPTCFRGRSDCVFSPAGTLAHRESESLPDGHCIPANMCTFVASVHFNLDK